MYFNCNRDTAFNGLREYETDLSWKRDVSYYIIGTYNIMDWQCVCHCECGITWIKVL